MSVTISCVSDVWTAARVRRSLISTCWTPHARLNSTAFRCTLQRLLVRSVPNLAVWQLTRKGNRRTIITLQKVACVIADQLHCNTRYVCLEVACTPTRCKTTQDQNTVIENWWPKILYIIEELSVCLSAPNILLNHATQRDQTFCTKA